MILDVTNVDKKLLIRSIYDMASPKGVGVVEYEVKKRRGELVHDISEYDCEIMLEAFQKITKEQHTEEVSWLEEDENPEECGIFVTNIDYVNGIPLKLNLYIPYIDFSKVYVYSDSYDIRNGLYLFLETLIKYFPLEDFNVVNKDYPDYWDIDEINYKENFDEGRYQALNTVASNLLPDGQVDSNILKSLDYFNNLLIDV
ncbi:hypothetical protein [Tenacibaculum discolor]|uniref:hypothetical protein n=1 Tax=Tenacibaculum discolor TaxID=361581 RepID=UPI000F16501C|nr:hypothetical protein [Tenacibaculum discolor]RLJ98803.1 hypothetical protein C8N27_2711 [Tenacibaculum discolor]